MDLKTAEVPLFQQTHVCFKMRQFHSRLKSVCVPRCVTKVSMHLSIILCSAVHNYDSLCRRSSRSPIMLQHSSSYDSLYRRSSRSPVILSILLVYIYIRKYSSTFYIGIAMVVLPYFEKFEFSLSVSTQFDFYQHQGGTHVES